MSKTFATTSGGTVVPDTLTSSVYKHWSTPLTTSTNFYWNLDDDRLTEEEQEIVDEVVREFGGQPEPRWTWRDPSVWKHWTISAPTSATPLTYTTTYDEE